MKKISRKIWKFFCLIFGINKSIVPMESDSNEILIAWRKNPSGDFKFFRLKRAEHKIKISKWNITAQIINGRTGNI